ncbi:MAG: hypothetical protein K9N49_07690 [Candidatus Marinimicrobia bacterium]|nr:hypothetical protein [Candidatus Neomarinimicrobiota bacterium]
MKAGWFQDLALVAALLLLRAAPAAGAGPAPVRIYDTRGLDDATQWVPVAGTPEDLDPRRTVIENGLVRLTYPAGKAAQGQGQTGSWLLFLNREGRYQPAQDVLMGDWLYVGSSLTTAPTGFRVLQNSAEIVEVRLDFDDHVQGNLDPPVPCGVRKTLILAAGHYGYVVHVDLARDDLRGEKESGFGASARHQFFYNRRGGHLRPDNTDRTVYPRRPGELTEWWAAGLPTDDSYYRLLAVRPAYPGALRTAQWSPGIYGYFYHWIWDPAPAFEVYIAAVPYDGRQAAEITIEDDSAVVTVPRDGVYTVYSRGENALYTAALVELTLAAGTHRLPLAGQALHDPRIAPISNGSDFPDDVCRQYHALRAMSQALSEME